MALRRWSSYLFPGTAKEEAHVPREASGLPAGCAALPAEEEGFTLGSAGALLGS